MERLRCMVRVLLAGGEDNSALDHAFAQAQKRHDRAVADLSDTMEKLTSEPGKSEHD